MSRTDGPEQVDSDAKGPGGVDLRVTLATNVRRLRRLRGLSNAALARSSEIGMATLSGVEKGTGNPTLETLQALSRSLGVPLGDLIDGSNRPPVTVIRSSEGARVHRPNLDLRFVHRFTAGGLDVVELYDMVVLSGEAHVSMGHPGVENILVTHGHVRMGPLDSMVTLGPGDFVSFAADEPHSYVALGGALNRAVLALRHSASEGHQQSAYDSVILDLSERDVL